MIIEFGVMSSKYQLEAEKVDVNSKLAMVLFFNTSAPIAIYSPIEELINPKEFLTPDLKVDNDEVRKIYYSIKEAK